MGNVEGAIIVEQGEAPDVETQRKLMASRAGEPVFRMWITKEEFRAGSFSDWICYELSDGRLALWRKFSDLRATREQSKMLYDAIVARRLDDAIT
jgi:hypothetical protein